MTCSLIALIANRGLISSSIRSAGAGMKKWSKAVKLTYKSNLIGPHRISKRARSAHLRRYDELSAGKPTSLLSIRMDV